MNKRQFTKSDIHVRVDRCGWLVSVHGLISYLEYLNSNRMNRITSNYCVLTLLSVINYVPATTNKVTLLTGRVKSNFFQQPLTCLFSNLCI